MPYFTLFSGKFSLVFLERERERDEVKAEKEKKEIKNGLEDKGNEICYLEFIN